MTDILSDSMNRLYSFDSTYSLTGANADIRMKIKPSQQIVVVMGLINELIASGNAIFICNNALRGVTGVLARRLQKTPAEIYARARANFIPGAILVPAGVAAVNALQESRFTYLQSA